MDTEALIGALDALDGGDPEMAHHRADDLILAALPQDVQDAYERLASRCRWWAYA